MSVVSSSKDTGCLDSLKLQALPKWKSPLTCAEEGSPAFHSSLNLLFPQRSLDSEWFRAKDWSWGPHPDLKATGVGATVYLIWKGLGTLAEYWRIVSCLFLRIWTRTSTRLAPWYHDMLMISSGASPHGWSHTESFTVLSMFCMSKPRLSGFSFFLLSPNSFLSSNQQIKQNRKRLCNKQNKTTLGGSNVRKKLLRLTWVRGVIAIASHLPLAYMLFYFLKKKKQTSKSYKQTKPNLSQVPVDSGTQRCPQDDIYNSTRVMPFLSRWFITFYWISNGTATP